MADEVPDDAVAPGDQGFLDSRRNIPYPVADAGGGDAGLERVLGVDAELTGPRVDGADQDGAGVIPDEAVAADDDVERDEVAIPDDAVGRADAVDDLVVEGDADIAGVAEAADDVAVAGTLASLATRSRSPPPAPGPKSVTCRRRLLPGPEGASASAASGPGPRALGAWAGQPTAGLADLTVRVKAH